MASPFTIDQLQARYGIENQVRFESGQGNLTRIVIQTPLAEAEIYLHGAHVTHWQPKGAQPVLFMSQKSLFEKDQPIRGGVPICFPWFGNASGQRDVPANASNHGFVRLRIWEVELVTIDPGGRVIITLTTRSDETTKTIWPHDFELRYTMTIGRELSLALQTRNTGSESFVVSEALHTYLRVSDVRKVQVQGLENQPYFDKTRDQLCEGSERSVQITEQTDRVYTDLTGPCLLRDLEFKRCLLVDKTGSATTVIWNPWIEKSVQMSDFGKDEWVKMLCIETANALKNTLTLAPGQDHQIRTIMSFQE